MIATLDATDRALLDRWQRGFPLVPHPFREIAAAHGIGEGEAVDRLASLAARGAISRLGATLRPNTAGASTLAAVAAPEDRIAEVAGAIGAEPGVNHSYLRENAWNIWFVATGPDRAHVDATLARIAEATGLAVLDLPLLRPFNIDLGFPLAGHAPMPPPLPVGQLGGIAEDDRALMQALTDGLEIAARPFAVLGAALGMGEAVAIARIRRLLELRVISRLGLILRHRALGWTSNAMVVWQVPEAGIDGIGPRLAAQPGVTLCYQRRPVPGVWPYTLYAMIHARSRPEALEVLERARAAAGLGGVPEAVLFSLRCFKQRGALVAHRPGGEAAA
ncbi:Lrp/AsnC family transcriptional regulator [Paralimibaculum aggregatum]|uniref:siroheme decarboxylase n=1 Tax=Paralimibaculum aggregatum TaxID=3036245 RepID=A0ABQ6LQQ5_9RHOB|nr:Lrp/AsnC family transcriptional regulator [Limibaculum sp. NKW23]GMG84397.1 Lrp/AsnC family transcriptional regulator [Limibaculum sp. NKW23]